ncbi:hypothetical protein [Nevskia sp.]|uniref:hypothetical protein n=1 Tax=Nevskia sp. TaxID=1929292 RepID=UPI0025EBE77B|nr:hypothetical protein [Nevskia sp.]
MTPQVIAQRCAWGNGVEVLVRMQHGEGRASIVKSLNLVPLEDGMLIEPTMRLDPTAAQVLIDSLWDCGLRPSSGSGSAGALAATQAHLEDMRTLTFKLLKTGTEAPETKPR